jgi:undecaprenyl-phosphate 4-deoxy-4-formamido-L-arabinose transferase
MGLLGEYIGRIYTDVRARPRWFIRKLCGKRPDVTPDGLNLIRE